MMKTAKKTNVSKDRMESGAAVGFDGADFGGSGAVDYEPRKMTLAENVILTIKVLGVAGSIMASLWGINYWTSAT